MFNSVARPHRQPLRRG